MDLGENEASVRRVAVEILQMTADKMRSVADRMERQPPHEDALESTSVALAESKATPDLVAFALEIEERALAAYNGRARIVSDSPADQFSAAAHHLILAVGALDPEADATAYDFLVARFAGSGLI